MIHFNQVRFELASRIFNVKQKKLQRASQLSDDINFRTIIPMDNINGQDYVSKVFLCLYI